MKKITPHQARILKMIAEGKTNKQIGAELNKQQRTIENITYNLRETFEAKNTVHLIAMAFKNGII